MFQGVVEYNNGEIFKTFFKKTEAEAVTAIKEQSNITTRYYKLKGIDYGRLGKLFTSKELNGGIKKAYIKEYQLVNTKTIKL